MSKSRSNAVFIGIKGAVLALDRTTGAELWRTALKGGDFVNLVMEDSDLYAATKGEIFCLEPVTGQIRWHNRLSGLGWGLVTIGAPAGDQTSIIAEKRRRDQAAQQAPAS